MNNELEGIFAGITDDELLIDIGYMNKENEELKQKLNNIKKHIEMIITSTDNQLVLAQCNLILEELK